MVYSKPLGGKSRIVKLVREMKKKIGSFTWAVLYICTLQKPFIASLKNEYQYIKILRKSIINNKNNQQSMFVTLIDIRLVTSWRLLVRPIIKSSNFREEKTEENWSEWLLQKVYIIVCYFSLIIFSTVELTSFVMRFACRELC